MTSLRTSAWEDGKGVCRYLRATLLRTFALIVSAHPTAHEIHNHVMHRARALSSEVNNNRANGHCYDFAWI